MTQTKGQRAHPYEKREEKPVTGGYQSKGWGQNKREVGGGVREKKKLWSLQVKVSM